MIYNTRQIGKRTWSHSFTFLRQPRNHMAITAFPSVKMEGFLSVGYFLSISCCTNNESQRLTTERIQKKREGNTELDSTKECAHVRFATWPKTFDFLANGNCFVRLRKNSLPVSVVVFSALPLLLKSVSLTFHHPFLWDLKLIQCIKASKFSYM